MSDATLLPTCFRRMSRSLFEELLNLLQKGSHIALIAPRQSGKALALFELRRLAGQLPGPDRPRVVILRGLDVRRDTESGFVRRFAHVLGVAASEVPDLEGLPLASAIVSLLHAALTTSRAPLWFFAQNITEFPGPFARGLLTALQEVSEDEDARGRLGVVVTGNQEFIPLTYHENSPYRRAVKFFLSGFDRDLTRRFFVARIVGFSLDKGFDEIPADNRVQLDCEALDFLYDQTDGYARFIEELVLTPNRPGPASEGTNLDVPWTRQRIEHLIDRFVKEHMAFEPFCKLSLRDVERDADAWELLQRLVDRSPEYVVLSGSQPHLLETSGIAHRDEHGIRGFRPRFGSTTCVAF